jgi:hypothetical protein
MKRKEERASENPLKLIKTITTGGIAEARQLITEMHNEKMDVATRNGEVALQKVAYKGQQEVYELLIPNDP